MGLIWRKPQGVEVQLKPELGDLIEDMDKLSNDLRATAAKISHVTEMFIRHMDQGGDEDVQSPEHS